MLALGIVQGVVSIRNGTGIPILAVMITVAVWYVGDAFYNDYANYHAKIFSPEVLSSAWLEVAWFIIVFLASVSMMHQQINARDLSRQSGVLEIFKYGVGQPEFQTQLTRLFKGCVLIWLFLGAIATMRLRGEVIHYFFPFIGYKMEPWGRDRIGGGFSALLTLAFYFQLISASVFGIAAALFTNWRLRAVAILFCALAWPYFLLDRTRNTMLAAVVPGILCWGLLRIRGNVLKKIAVLAGCFVVVNAWMAFVIANRSEMTIVDALHEKGFKLEDSEKTHHEGLNMYEELCWVNTFIENGTYHPNWGSRYFAELVNPIPRALWHNKPLIGIDYAIARGQTGGDASGAGVNATVSTGMIGQGVVNFGRILGPAAAALLMALWVAVLARQDLHIGELGRLPLYACGLILTFNLGRDITLLTLYPFVFGVLTLWWFERNKPRSLPQKSFAPSGQNIAATAPDSPSRRRPHAKTALRNLSRQRANRRTWSR